MLERAIHQLLSGLAGGRIYNLRAPQNVTFPCIVYQQTTGGRFQTLQDDDPLKTATIQVDCYAEQAYTANTLAASVEAILRGYRGTVSDTNSPSTWSVRIGSVTIQDEVSILDETTAKVLSRRSVQYLVIYE